MIALYLALIAFVVISAFVVVSTFKRLLDEGIEVSWWLKAIAYVWLLIGVPADVAFNYLFGTFIFRERPRLNEPMFTARLKRHYYNSSGWRYDKADKWRSWVNAVDAGHV